MESIHQKIEAEYRQIRLQNQEERKRRTELLYAKIPKLKELEEETYRAYARLTAQLFENGADAEENSKKIQELQQEKKKLMRQAGYPEHYLDTIYTCRECQDSGFVHATTPCDCYREKKRKYLYEAANLSPVMQTQSFDNFSFDFYSKVPLSADDQSPYDYAVAIFHDCRNFVEKEEYLQGTNLFLYGDPGLGKTFLCSCIARELVARDVPVLYQTAYRLFKILEDARFKKDETCEALEKQFYEIPVLMIDDLGTEFVTTYTSAVLFDLINSRVQNKKSTIISSNLSMSLMKENYSDRVQSRIFGEFKLLKLQGSDIRKQQAF